jgi:NADH-quinone oxidoreductase subunit A
MYFTLLVVVILTAIALVAVALGIARAISPRSYNSQKGEAYECGIPTRGRSWMQFKVGYYLFAILFLMFDVETVFLFPWAVVVQDLGVYGLFSILFFLVILVLGLARATSNPKRAKSYRAAPTAINSIPQQLVANVSGHNELLRPQLIRSSKQPTSTLVPPSLSCLTMFSKYSLSLKSS